MNATAQRNGNMYKDVKTWNPYVGCKYNCVYCKPSFQRMVRRVFECQGKKCTGCRDFLPHEHPDRLSRGIPAGKVIWPCAHGDITFARPEFIEQVIKKTEEYPMREFYWQSKNPTCFNQYLKMFPMPDTILLTTLETNRDEGYENISKAPMPSIRYKDFRDLQWPRQIVTIEPILDFDPEILLQWLTEIAPESIWIGYNSKPSSVRLPEPEPSKTIDFIEMLRKSGFVVREKTMRPI
jgi:hypothetical protein